MNQHWWRNSHVVLTAVTLIMAIVTILAVAEAVRVRSQTLQLQNRASAVQERADQSIENLISACIRGNALRRAVTHVLNQFPDPESIRMLDSIEPVDCIATYRKDRRP